MQRAAKLRRTQIELGNISGTVVCEDANIEKASVLTARAAFRKAGQICVSVQRLFVHPSIVDAFTEARRAHRTDEGGRSARTRNIGRAHDRHR